MEFLNRYLHLINQQVRIIIMILCKEKKKGDRDFWLLYFIEIFYAFYIYYFVGVLYGFAPKYKPDEYSQNEWKIDFHIKLLNLNFN